MAKKKTISKRTTKKVVKAAKKNPKPFIIAIVIILIIAIAAGVAIFLMRDKIFPKETSFTLNGGKVESVALNSEYQEKGAKAIYKGEDISKEISIK